MVKLTVLLSLIASATCCSGMVNHLPSGGSGAVGEKLAISGQLDGLNRVLKAEFSGLASFPFWQHVGMVGMGSGVYLGDGQVLTSAHVGCHPFQSAQGKVHAPVAGTWRVLANEDGSASDLAIFKIEVPQGSALAALAAVPLGQGADTSGPTVMMGTGFVQGAKPVTLSSGGRVLAVMGYQVQPRRGLTWGIGRSVSKMDQAVKTGADRFTQCFATRFDRGHFAGQAADGDSGGAAFRFNRKLNRWELVGCIIAVSQKQLNVTFGARTYFGHLESYRSQIDGGKAAPLPLATERVVAARVEADVVTALPAVTEARATSISQPVE